jgi:hypothetical protein
LFYIAIPFVSLCRFCKSLSDFMAEPHQKSDPVAELGQKLSKRLGGRGLAVRALPVFDLRKGAATTFACVPSRMGSDTNAFGHWLLQGLDEASLASLDLEMLD